MKRLFVFVPVLLLLIGCATEEVELPTEGDAGPFESVVSVEYVIGRDGAEMALIPASVFEMGTDSSEIPALVQWVKTFHLNYEPSMFERETPRHKVYLDAFYMDMYEVTNAQYKKFMDATGHRAPECWSRYAGFDAPDQPVTGVSWYDAVAYAEWVGKRLPTEAEWEKAARGGLMGKKFHWGNTDPDGTQCNFADRYIDWEWAFKSVDDGYHYLAPVGSYSPNRYGLYDMAGNVWEWCADWFGRHYYRESPERNPTGLSSGTERIARGGGWRSSPDGLRVAHRWDLLPTAKDRRLGFRCVQDVAP